MKNRLTLLLETRYGDLRASEKKAASYILSHMNEIRGMSLEQLAVQCQVSQPTVIRMLKALYVYLLTLKNLSVKTYRSILDILNRARRIDIYSVEITPCFQI